MLSVTVSSLTVGPEPLERSVGKKQIQKKRKQGTGENRDKGQSLLTTERRGESKARVRKGGEKRKISRSAEKPPHAFEALSQGGGWERKGRRRKGRTL